MGVLIIVVCLGCVFVLYICCVLGSFLLFKMLLGSFNVLSGWEVSDFLFFFLIIIIILVWLLRRVCFDVVMFLFGFWVLLMWCISFFFLICVFFVILGSECTILFMVFGRCELSIVTMWCGQVGLVCSWIGFFF